MDCMDRRDRIRSQHRGVRAAVAACFLGAALLIVPAPASAETEWEEAGVGAGAALLNLLYIPAKVGYAAFGSTVAGLAWIVSAGDYDVFGPILDASLRGDYVLTPDHLRGERPLRFVGRSPRAEPVAASPDASWNDANAGAIETSEEEWSSDYSGGF